MSVRELAALTLNSIESQSAPLWWPGLAVRLVDDFARRSGSDVESYSTSAWLTQGTLLPARLHSVGPTGGSFSPAVVEVMPKLLQQRYDLPNCRFLQADELDSGVELDLLAEAMHEIGAVPELAATVAQVARRMHLLVTHDDEFDVSFSEPELPLSVFVSIPRSSSRNVPWRIAEAVVHESAHLQLSLVERVVPLIESAEAQHYSPWRNANRSLGGVLHGLYVFGVIAEWIASYQAPPPFVRRRLKEIATEASEIQEFPDTGGLTRAGADLARSILARIAAATERHLSADAQRDVPNQKTR